MFVCVYLCACDNDIFFSGPNNKPRRKSSYYREANRLYSSDAGLSDSNQILTVHLVLTEV